MIITITAAAIAVAFTPADASVIADRFGLEEAQEIVLQLDTDGNVEDIENAELVNDDRALCTVCGLVEEYCTEHAAVLTAKRSRIPFEQMLDYLDARHGRDV